MRIYMQSYTRDGKQHECETHACEFRDHGETVRRLSLFESKAASEQVANFVSRLVDFRRAKMQPDAALNEWLAVAPSRIVRQLAAWGILDQCRVQAAKPMKNHLDEWKAALLAKGVSGKHAAVSFQRASDVLADCQCLSDLNPDHVRRFISDRVTAGPKSKNYYTAACKAFTRWTVREGRLPVDPLACLQPIGAKTLAGDVRRKRRALTAGECSALLTATEAAPFRWGMTGPKRALLYRLALETGLRAGELHSLTAGAFHLDTHPCVTLDGDQTKNGKAASLPLREATVDLLKTHLANRLPTALAFNMPPSTDTAEMLRADLEAAGIPATNAAKQRVDFHGLRHTFITNLANSGVHPKVAQDLARHSDINLTMTRYSHTLMEQRAEAVDMLPDLDAVRAADAVRQATTDEPVAQCANAKQTAKQLEARSVSASGKSGSAYSGVGFESGASRNASVRSSACHISISSGCIETVLRRAD